MSIKRYLSEENLNRLMRERGYLVKNIINSKGELQLCLRDNYFNVYYRGNSLAKVEFKSEDKYAVGIHKKFVPDTIINDADFSTSFKVIANKDNDTLYYFEIDQPKLRKLLRQKYIEDIKAKIAEVGFKEELEFQHTIVEDNVLNEIYCFIDIQVTDSCFDKKRIDLIALRNVEGNRYRLVIGEVKLGNNKELSDSVYYQVKEYSEHIKKHFNCYRDTYEKQYSQLKQLGLIPAHKSKTIVIDDEIEEMIIVGRHLVSAKEQIDILVQKHPDIKDKVKLLSYEL